MVEQDYYDLLGVPRGADDAAIKAAYRRLAKEHHPDRHNGCSDKEAQFKAINEAYDVLKDPQKRAAYDRFGEPRSRMAAAGTTPSPKAASTAFPTSSRRSSASSWTRARSRTPRAAPTFATTLS